MTLPRPRLGLLARTALAFGAVGLLPLALSHFGLVGVNRDALFDQVLKTHALAARTAAARVEAFLDTRLSLARGAAGDRALADPRSPQARELLARSLQAWAGLGVEAVAVVNRAGQEVIRAQLKGGAARRAGTALRPPWDAPVVAVAGQRPPALRIAAPLAGGAGWLVLLCNGSPLADVALPEELEGDAELAVVDRTGRVVLGEAASLDDLPAHLMRSALTGRVGGAGRYRDRRGTEILSAFAPVPASGWAVISRQPARVAEAVALRLRRRSTLALGAALALIGGLLGLAYAAVVRPIRELAGAQRALAKAGPSRGGSNEIDDLRSSFEALRLGLAERRALDDIFLGRYQVIELLAVGGMGSVFRGWDPELQRAVALKTVRLGSETPAAERREKIAQLVQEAVTAARFSHPNVAHVYDVAASPAGAFMAMELVDGISLEQLLARRGRLRPEEVIPLGAGIARGLAAAHARGIVHRDVKPANVLLGRDGAVKVTDFGVAALVSAAAGGPERVFGTPAYLPPESLHGGGQTQVGDLFALGVLLYECLTGDKPFGGPAVSDIVHNTLFGVARPLGRQVEDEMPCELESLIFLLLEKDPIRRPASAAAVAAELERLAAERGLRWSLDDRQSGGLRSAPAPRLGAQWIRTTRLTGGGHSPHRA